MYLRNFLILITAVMLMIVGAPALATFELKDPANEIYYGEEEEVEPIIVGLQPATDGQPARYALCAIGQGETLCDCRDKETDQAVEIDALLCEKLLEDWRKNGG